MLRWIRSRRDRLCFYAARQFILGQCAPYSVISPWVAAIICLYMERQFIFGTVNTVFPSCYYSICTLYTTVVISPWVKLLICLSIPPCVMCVWRRGNGCQKISQSLSSHISLLIPITASPNRYTHKIIGESLLASCIMKVNRIKWGLIYPNRNIFIRQTS